MNKMETLKIISSIQRKQIAKRLSEKSSTSENGCIEYSGATGKDGYGVISFLGEIFRTHRLSYFLSYGPFDWGLFVCHKCDNRKCINPEHLFLGTAYDNFQDAKLKGRLSKGKESKFPREDIMQFYNSIDGHQEYKLQRMMQWFNVSRTHLMRILKDEGMTNPIKRSGKCSVCNMPSDKFYQFRMCKTCLVRDFQRLRPTLDQCRIKLMELGRTA